jgi:hypothetical protein
MGDLLAAGATAHHHGSGVLVGLAAAAAIAYAASCAWWPFGKCHKCHGTGRIARSDGRVFRLCPRCKSTGRRLRIGRRVWNLIHPPRRERTK